MHDMKSKLAQKPVKIEDNGIPKIDELLKLLIDKGASDLHLMVQSSPVLRVNGLLIPQEDIPPLSPDDVNELLAQTVTKDQRNIFNNEHELDSAYSVAGLGRFRINALKQRGSTSLAFRLIPYDIPTIDELELPQVCKQLILRPRGLILVTGPSGSGKSTTLAAMINHLNKNEHRNVIMIEEPIEFLFRNDKCIIHQREIGSDTKSFSKALKHSLRHDPDVIIIGEMRDITTISAAMSAAETGHLVLGTLHTYDAAQSIDRIIDVFPPAQQRQVRLQLSQVLEAVLSQSLLPRVNGGRIAAFEIMLATSVVRRLIRDEKIWEITPNIEMGTKEGSQSMNQALADLVRHNIVAKEDAVFISSDPIKLDSLISNRDRFECVS
jgi:twitching motility protein PilT